MDRVELLTSTKGYKVYFKALAGPLDNWKPIVTILINLNVDGEFETIEYNNSIEDVRGFIMWDLKKIEEYDPNFIRYINAARAIYKAFDETQDKFKFPFE